MTQAGGPAAINGFLYQILHHLGWIAEISLTNSIEGLPSDDACLVLEPVTGGDAIAEVPGIFLAEQYKTRPDGTWALSDIQEVVVDLYKSVPPTLPSEAEYRFVTDGRPGKLDAFQAFLSDVKAAENASALDDVEERAFNAEFSGTNRGYFIHLAAKLEATLLKSSRVPVDRDILLHLLSRFQMQFGIQATDRIKAIEQLLRPYVHVRGTEAKVRRDVVGALFTRLAVGEARLNAVALDQMLEEAGVSPHRLRKFAMLSETLMRVNRLRLKRYRYHRDTDIRPVPTWPSDKPVLLVTGESGSGKTWQLGKLLETCAEQQQIAIYVEKTDSAEEILSRAARGIWQTGLGETTDQSLQAISLFVRRDFPQQTAAPTITVIVDEVQSLSLARDLVRQDWSEWGMRLALAVSPSIARALALTDPDKVHVNPLADFSVDELDTLLRKHGRRWLDLPLDLKRLLRSPILAGLYLQLPYTSALRAPRSEYEIFEAFWQRIDAGGSPADKGVLIALAAHFHQGKAYPLPTNMWNEIGLTTPEAHVRLETAGWLRTGENGELSFAHDRLLNWAVAMHIFVKAARSELAAADIADILEGCDSQAGDRYLRRLNYVPMDVLWLLAEKPELLALLGAVAELLEKGRNYGSYGIDLYVDLLPTMGDRAVGVLLARLDAVSGENEKDYKIGLIAKAFVRLCMQEGFDQAPILRMLVHSSSDARQRVALAALKVAPDPETLDRIWSLHRSRVNSDENGDGIQDYKESMAALRAGVEVAPEWLRQRILDPTEQPSRLTDLAYLLCGLEHPEAKDIWLQTSETLLRGVPESKPRSLLNAIARFGDMKRVDFILANLERKEDWANGAAFAALSMMDPATAIDQLGRVELSDLYPMRGQWLPALLHANGTRTREKLLETARNKRGHSMIEEIFWERPDELDRDLLVYILRDLEREMRKKSPPKSRVDSDWLFYTLDFLSRVSDADLLPVLAEQAGSDLEAMIFEAACSRLDRDSNYVDSVKEGARRVLLLVGGTRFTELINAELSSQHFWVRHTGLQWAFVRPNEETVRLLSSIAGRPLLRDENGKPESNLYREFYDATVALAAIGADEALVAALWSVGISEVPISLPRLRAHKGALAPGLTERARDVLLSDDSDIKGLLSALTVAWLSHDKTLIPPVRALLRNMNDAEDKVAGFACVTLDELRDSSDEFAGLAARLFDTTANAHFGLSALAGLGATGAELLSQRKGASVAGAISRLDSQVIRVLYETPATRPLAIQAAKDACQGNRSIYDVPYDIAVEADDGRIREILYEDAFTIHSFVTARPLLAIKGFAKIDVPRAVEAIELALENHPKIERELCRLLVTIAPSQAAQKLMAAVQAIERESLRSAVGHALRALQADDVIQPVAAALLGTKRKAAIAVAAWLPMKAIEEILVAIAGEEPVREIRLAGLGALETQKAERAVSVLLSEFPSADANQRWRLLAAILERGDPFLLTKSDDTNWLGRIFTENVPDAYAHYADSFLRRRKQKRGEP